MKFSSSAQINTWASMIVRGLIFATLIFYAGNVLNPINSTIFLILISILSFQGILDFGFIPSFVRVIAYVNSDKNNYKSLIINGFDYSNTSMDEVMHVFNWIYIRLTILFFLIVSIGGFFSITGIVYEAEEKILAWSSLGITSLGGVFFFSHSRYAAILTGLNRIALQKKIELYANIPTLILLLIGFAFKINYFLILCILNFSFIFLYFLTRKEVSKLVNNENILENKLNVNLLKNIFSTAWKSGLGVFMTMGTINGSAIIVSNLVAPELASKYLIAQRLIIAIGSYCYVPFQIIIPKISNMYASNNIKEALDLASKAKNKVIVLVIFFGISVLFFTEYFLPFTNIKFNFIDIDIWLLLVIYTILERAGAVSLQTQTINNVVRWHIANGFSGVIMLTMIPILYNSFGLIGVPLSFIVSYMFFYYPYSVNKLYMDFKYFNLSQEFFSVITPVSILFLLFIIL